MMRFLLSVAFVLSVAMARAEETKPTYLWNFERTNKDGCAVNAGQGLADYVLYLPEQPRAGQGVGGSSAVWSSDREGKGTISRPLLSLDWNAFTLDLAFRINDDLAQRKEPATLAQYLWSMNHGGEMTLSLQPDGRFRVVFRRPGNEIGFPVDKQAVSSVCLVRPGVYHRIRLSVAENGVLAFYFDGVQVIGEKGMPSLSGIKVLPPKWWPILFFGVDSNDPEHLRGRLNGLIDDVALYDRALGAPGTETAETADYSGVAIPKFSSAGDATTDILILDASGRAKTDPFRVLDTDAGHGAGAWFKADDKFVKCAARAAIGVTADTLTVSVDCPVPAGLEIAREKGSVWSGDLVEIFLRPSLSDRSYFHYAVNAAGLTFARHIMANGSSDPAFKSAFASEVKDTENGFRVVFRMPRGEVFERALSEGDVFAANFTRGGKTVGGLSTWAAVGRNFNEPDLFGRVVIGGAKAYFDRLLAEKRAEAGRMFTAPAQVEIAGKALADAERAVSDHAGNLAAFTSLESYFANLDRMFLQLAMNGRNYMLYSPDDPWGNDIAPSRTTRPLGKIRIVMPANARTYHPLAVANFIDERFIGRFKMFDGDPGKKFYDAGTKGAARHFTWHETIPVPTAGGKDQLDLVSPLPINGLVRVGARENLLLWLECDSRGLKPGVHYLKMIAKPARKRYAPVTIPVELEVKDMDMDSVEVDRMEYTQIQYKGVGHPNLLKFLADRKVNFFLMNTPGYEGFKICPKFKDGQLVPGDLTDFDRQVDAVLASGVPGERLKLIICVAVEYDWNSILLPDGSAMAKCGSKEWRLWLETLVRDVMRHAQERYGIGKERIIWYPVDEPDGPIDDPTFKSKMSRAYLAGKLIKAIDPEIRTFVNPHPYLKPDEFAKDVEKLSECFDTIEFCRQFYKPESAELARKFGFREVWTYEILEKGTHPSTYRGDLWKNLRDGFSAFTPFWHYEEGAGGDIIDPNDGGKNVTDYGAAYVDFDSDAILPSRRLIAHDMAWEDARLIKFLRQKYANDPALLEKIRTIIKAAADRPSMENIEQARMLLLEL